MDFKRIQILLLVFFVMFDIYLFYLLSEKSPFNQTSHNATAQVNTLQEIRSRGIVLSERVHINDEHPELPIIKVDSNDELKEASEQLENQSFSLTPEGVLTSQFTHPLDLDISLGEDNKILSQKDFTWIWEHILSNPKYFIQGAKYLNHWYSPQDNMISVRMVVDLSTENSDNQVIPISDGTAELRLLLDDDYRLQSYIQSFQANPRVLEAPKRLISSHEALEVIQNRIDTTLPNDSTIISMSLSYYQSVNTQNFKIYTPAWEIIYFRRESSQTQSILVDALRGKVVEIKSLTSN